VLNLLVVKRGEAPIPGLTDEEKPIRLGPKRANKIRKLFGLSPSDSVTDHVVRRECTTKAGKTYKKAPKIQRLITSVQLQRKRHRVALKRQRAAKNKTEQASYAALVQQRAKEAKDRRAELLQKRRSSHGSRHSQ
jgi:small subunit ribosomal protein S6e